MAETLLAHLAGRLAANQWENIATESLAFLLRTPAASAGLQKHARGLRADLPEISQFETQCFAADDNAIPDLVGITKDGVGRLIIEVKFDAALTPNQPVAYLERLLPASGSGLLLFLVPARRLLPVWDEIIRRCTSAGHDLTVNNSPAHAAQIGDVTVAVTSWSDLLHDLDHALRPRSEHEQQIAELQQLRGLCERQDRETFQPFTTGFLGGDIGQHIIDLDVLINDAVARIVRETPGATTGLKWSSGQHWFGRYVRLGGWVCLLHVNFKRWGHQRPTPLWLRITDARADATLIQTLLPLAGEQPPRFINDDGSRQIPIDVPHDESRDVVFARIDAQVRRVEELLISCPPPPTAPIAVEIEDEAT